MVISIALSSGERNKNLMIGRTLMKLIPKQETPRPLDQASPELEQQIRCRAYELYEERGRTDGYEVDDWLRAESEVTSGKSEALVA